LLTLCRTKTDIAELAVSVLVAKHCFPCTFRTAWLHPLEHAVAVGTAFTGQNPSCLNVVSVHINPARVSVEVFGLRVKGPRCGRQFDVVRIGFVGRQSGITAGKAGAKMQDQIIGLDRGIGNAAGDGRIAEIIAAVAGRLENAQAVGPVVTCTVQLHTGVAAGRVEFGQGRAFKR